MNNANIAVASGVVDEPASGLQVAICILVFEQDVNDTVVPLFPQNHFLNLTIERSFDGPTISIVRASFIVVAINTESNVNDAIILLLLNQDMVLALNIYLSFFNAGFVVRSPISPLEFIRFFFLRNWSSIS